MKRHRQETISRRCIHRSAFAVFVIGIVVALTGYPSRSAQAQIVMKLSTATLNDVQHEWIKRYAAAIEKNSNARIKTEIYPASQLGSIPRQIEGTQLGSIQVWVGPPEFLVGVDPKFELLSVPGLIPSEDVAVKTMRDPEFSKEFTNSGVKKGLIGLTLSYNGPIVFAMRAPVRTLGEFKGKKIRVLASPFQTEQMTKLGATGVAMSLGDVLPAIQQGTIDGAMSSAGVFRALQYYDAAKYLTEANHAYVFSIAVVSKRWFDTLPADLQEVVLRTAKEASDDVLPWSLNFVAEQRKLWTDKGGEYILLSPEDRAQLMKMTAPIGAEVVKTRADTKSLWDLLNATVKRVQ
jgi:TRAP-type C4-dicarboxylate transport system substrate-binding protein